MTELVGILNITPDSFSDGGQYNSPGTAVAHADQLFRDGAVFIDIGAESTRPNAVALSDDEEWTRLEPVLKELIPRYPGRISLDSYHPKNIQRAFEIGPVIINDVTCFNNPEMVKIAVKQHARVIICHLPKMSIQEAHTQTPVSEFEEVKRDLLAKAIELQKTGLKKEKIILDPGIGFGKTMELNNELLKFAEHIPDYQVMIGYSRKRFLGQNRMELEPNLEAGKVAIKHGTAYLRVHDVAGHKAIVT